jgi:hypothetical protein
MGSVHSGAVTLRLTRFLTAITCCCRASSRCHSCVNASSGISGYARMAARSASVHRYSCKMNAK